GNGRHIRQPRRYSAFDRRERRQVQIQGARHRREFQDDVRYRERHRLLLWPASAHDWPHRGGAVSNPTGAAIAALRPCRPPPPPPPPAPRPPAPPFPRPP